MVRPNKRDAVQIRLLPPPLGVWYLVSMAKLSAKASLTDYQKLIERIYAYPDDRLFSISDLISNQERFTMRALKGIRKGDKSKLTLNLMIAFSWLMAVANRLHIDVEGEVWKRFPRRCSYCGAATCECKKVKTKTRKRLGTSTRDHPSTISGYQRMFERIYPANTRNLSESGVHLAEEMGELSEAVHNFLGQHTKRRFAEIELEIADFVSCVFGVANSAGIDIARTLARMFKDNCHSCHKLPCECSFHKVAEFNS